jgi:large subunit ribosomal protein L9
MKVILLQDVAKIGRRFDVVEVPSGYGMNKLIPQGMAKPATPENLKAIQAQSAKTEADRVASDEAFEAMLASLKGVTLEIAVEANEEGRMFQALKIDAVIEALKTSTDTNIDQSKVVIKTPIKEVGDHVIELVSGDRVQSVEVSIVAK